MKFILRLSLCSSFGRSIKFIYPEYMNVTWLMAHLFSRGRRLMLLPLVESKIVYTMWRKKCTDKIHICSFEKGWVFPKNHNTEAQLYNHWHSGDLNCLLIESIPFTHLWGGGGYIHLPFKPFNLIRPLKHFYFLSKIMIRSAINLLLNQIQDKPLYLLK